MHNSNPEFITGYPFNISNIPVELKNEISYTIQKDDGHYLLVDKVRTWCNQNNKRADDVMLLLSWSLFKSVHEGVHIDNLYEDATEAKDLFRDYILNNATAKTKAHTDFGHQLDKLIVSVKKHNKTIDDELETASESVAENDPMEQKLYTFILFSYAENSKIYDWEIWKQCVPIIDSLLKYTDYQPSISSKQGGSGKKGYLPFGRMIWSEKNNKKWTSKYRTAPDKVSKWHIYDTEIWAPSRNKCLGGKWMVPDFFIKIVNDDNLHKNGAPFNNSMVISIKEEVYAQMPPESVKLAFEKLYTITSGIQSGTAKIKWMHRANSSVVYYKSCLMDLNPYAFLSDRFGLDLDAELADWETHQ